jgi:hypothetical protein
MRTHRGTGLLVLVGSLGAAALVACSHGKPPAPSASNASSASSATTAPSAAASAPTAPGPAAPAAPVASGAAAAAPASAPPTRPDLVLLAGAAFDACPAPTQPPAPPDGQVATREQMLVSHKLTADFNSETNDYLACLDKAQTTFDRQYGALLQLAGLRDVANLHNRIHNQAVDADHGVADKFNQQLRAYKARGGTS